MTDGLKLLAQDHGDIEALFARYAASRDEPIAHEIFDRLTAHTAMEEQAFYPEVRRIVDGGDDLADRAQTEHATVTALVVRALATPPSDMVDLVDQLQRDVAQHVAFEEQELFPELYDSGVDAEKLGAALQEARAAFVSGPGL
jgi:hemerythrin superfamily protein